MRTLMTTAARVFGGIGLVLLLTPPALAQEGGGRPWHYWLAPFLLGGAVLVLAAVGVGYWIRIAGGSRRR